MNERPSLVELEAFASIHRHRSFRRAADALELSPSTLSHTLRALESRLGVRLLNRTTRSVAPTEAGERLAARLGPMLAELEDALAEATSDQDAPRGPLRINAPDAACLFLLQTVVPDFLRRHPAVSLELVAEMGFVDIVAEGFDAGVRFGEAAPRDMIAVPVGGPARMLAVAAPAYLAQAGRPEAPGDLSTHPCIRLRMASGRVYRWEFERRGETLKLDPQGALTLNRSELVVEAAVAGLGVAFLPDRLTAPHRTEGSLTALLEDWSPPFEGLHLYYPGRRGLRPPLRAFVDAIRASPALR